MGWALLAIETTLAYACAYLSALALFREETSARRLTTTFALGPAWILFLIQVASVGHLFATWPLAALGLVVFGGVSAALVRSLGVALVRERAYRDLLAPVRIVVDAWKTKEIAFLNVGLAIYFFGLAALLCFFYRSWMFDPVWYHVTLTDYVIQERGLTWISSINPYVQGYPRNVELIAAWACVFPMDSRFDDIPQLPFALLGIAATAAWARRLELSRSLSAAVAATWYALPPVFLIAPSSYVDLATGSLLIAGAYFAFGKEPKERLIAFVIFGMYAGSKFTGLYHFLCFTPILLVGALRSWMRRDTRGTTFFAELIGGGLLTALFGAYQYVQNWVHKGNPVYPYETKTAFFGTFPGPETVEALYGIRTTAEESLYLFRYKGAFREFVQRWLQPATEFRYTPEIQNGGFGPVFFWFLLPALFIGLGESLKGKWRRYLPLLFVFVVAISVPAARWPRYTIGGPAALLVVFGCVLAMTRQKVVRAAISLALVGLTASVSMGALQGWQEIYPSHFKEMLRATAIERASIPLGAHWTYDDALRREFELRPGDVVTYDESANFISNFFNHDFRHRVEYVPSAGDPQDFVRRVRAASATWAGVTQGTPAERALQQAGAQKLFVAQGTTTVVYRMPRP